MGREDDILYLKILIFSFFTALVVKKLPQGRDFLCGFVGFGTILVVCGWNFLYSFGLIAINVLIYKFCDRK